MPYADRHRPTRRTVPATCVLALVALLAGCTSGASAPTGAGAGTTPPSSTGTAPTGGSASPTPPSTTPPPPPDACARSVLAGLDLAGQAGQVLMIGVSAVDPVGDYQQLTGQRIGSVFLAGGSEAGADAVRAAVAEVQRRGTAETGAPLWVSVDQEGGFVQRLTGPGFSTTPTAVEQGQQPDLAARTGVWAAEVAGVGINLDLAPVADVVPAGTANSNPPIGASARQFGSDPPAVAADITTVVTAMRAAGLGTTVKHFPGLGRVTVNTDTGRGATDPQTTADDPALQPFVAGIAAGTDAVMMSSASYPALDPDRLAAFSPTIITDLLKGTLGFTGMVVSDDLGNAVAVSDRPVGQRAVDFLAAGGDLALSVNPGDGVPMRAAVVQRAQNDAAFAARLADAALRVLTGKQEAGLLTC